MNIATQNKIEIVGNNIPGSLVYKKTNLDKANKALRIAKSLNRPVRYAAQNESEFARQIQIEKESINNEKISTIQAAKLIKVSTHLIRVRKNNGSLPFEMIDGKLFFNREDILNMPLNRNYQ